MFFTLQFPFADLRPFLDDPPATVIPKIKKHKPQKLNKKEPYKDRYKKGFVRSFDCAQFRGYDPRNIHWLPETVTEEPKISYLSLDTEWDQSAFGYSHYRTCPLI